MVWRREGDGEEEGPKGAEANERFMPRQKGEKKIGAD